MSSIKRPKPPISALVTGGTGATTRRRGISTLARTAQGVYLATFPADRRSRADEFHFTVTPVNAAARHATLTPAADGTTLQVNMWDAAGAAADSDFMLAGERI